MFFNFLVKCDGVAKEHNWNANTPDVICMLVSKLSNALIDRWNRIAYNIRKRHECEPSLSDLIELLTKRHWLTIQCFHDKLLKALMEKARNNQKGEIGD